MHWQLAAFDELSAAQLYQMLALRCEIFVVEQDCAYQDPDGLDLHPQTRHLNLWRGGQLLATARLLGGGGEGARGGGGCIFYPIGAAGPEGRAGCACLP
ncbi:hypothetical protein CGX12_06770, partial [Zobellella denitrificans]